MDDPVSTGLAVLAVALFGLALYLLTQDSLMLAGLSFLSASVAIYFRETRREEDA